MVGLVGSALKDIAIGKDCQSLATNIIVNREVKVPAQGGLASLWFLSAP